MAERNWPDDWNERMAGQGCPLCAALGHGDNDYCVHVFAGEFAEVNLDRRTRLPPSHPASELSSGYSAGRTATASTD
jgi:hypothetical protein